MKDLTLDADTPALPLSPGKLKLTTLSSCAGCAAKLGQAALHDVLRRLPPAAVDRRLLVGAGTADDAGVYALDRDTALVQTVDFFTPIVDDAFDYGRIAATNAISDVYAMGGRPLTALNLLGIPSEIVGPAVVARILRGGAVKAAEAGCTIVGGHTIKLPEPVYGMAVTGIVSPRRIIANTGARVGDHLVLTKRLGTGITTTAIKRGFASATLRRLAVESMTTLNTIGADLAERELVRAGTDITGFGLLGHLANICRGSGVGAEIDASAVPALSAEVWELIERDCIPGGSRQNRKTADEITDWGDAPERIRYLLTDAQTSGGLLLCVPPAALSTSLGLLRRANTLCAAHVGRIIRAPEPQIRIVVGGDAARSAASLPVTKSRIRRRPPSASIRS